MLGNFIRSLHFSRVLAVLPLMLAITALGMAPALCQFSHAAYPDKPIRLIVGFTPGGTADGVGRILAAAIGPRLGQSIVVENRAGANGNIATDLVQRAAPDGYTIFFTSIGHAVNPSLYKEAKYDPVKDFTPIGQVLSAPNVLVVPASSPFNNVKELIAFAKANPGKLDFASSGGGASVHLSGELFKQLAGIYMVHIPYRGTGSLLPDLLSGQVAMSFPNLPSALPFVQNGKLKALGVTTDKRSAAAPNIPTLAEAGVPGYNMSTWYGLIGPANMQPDIVRRLNLELRNVLQDPQVRNKLIAQGVDPVTGSPEAFSTFIENETKSWAALLKKIKVELN
jgi:tripartite-type tricarboxylate transporter receptor subunit TctC